MNCAWIAMEHHRLHLIEQWPESAHKSVAIAACRSTLESLLRTHRSGELPICDICGNRSSSTTVVQFPRPFQTGHRHTNLAA